MRVIELRNYLLKDGATRDFIRYFEEHFLFAQREEGMHVLGQFGVVGEPNRFGWIGGFESMEARFRGLSGFYSGPFWDAHRDPANEMMLEHYDVHLLRPLGPITALTGGSSLKDRTGEPPGVLPPEAGVVAVDFYRTHPGALDGLIGLFEHRLRSALVARGHQVLGHFVAELAPNDYPRLPVSQGAVYVVFTREKMRNPEEYEHYREKALPAAQGHLLKPLALYGKYEMLEGPAIEGAVILEFPTVDAAKTYYNSPAYQDAVKHRFLGADYRVFIVEGL